MLERVFSSLLLPINSKKEKENSKKSNKCFFESNNSIQPSTLFNTHARCIQRDDESWTGQLKTRLSFSLASNSSPFSQHAPESPPISNLSSFHSSIHLLNPQGPVFSSTYSPPISLGQKCQYTDHHSQVRTLWASRAPTAYFSAPYKVASVSHWMGVQDCHFWLLEE